MLGVVSESSQAGEKKLQTNKGEAVGRGLGALPYLDYGQQTEHAQESLRFTNQEKAGPIKGRTAHGPC